MAANRYTGRVARPFAGPRQQQGITTFGWLLVVVLIAFFAMLAIRLVPIYLEYFNVRSAMNGLESAPEVGTTSREVRAALMKRLDINRVAHVQQDDVTVEPREEAYVVNVNYDVRVPFVGNIDLLVSFDHQARVPAR